MSKQQTFIQQIARMRAAIEAAKMLPDSRSAEIEPAFPLWRDYRDLPIRPAGRFQRTPKRVAEYDATRNL